MDAGQSAFSAIDESRRNKVIAITAALLLSGWLGLTTFRRIEFNRSKALEASVKSIAAGDYAGDIPFTKATDETELDLHDLSTFSPRAAAMDEQRWVKSNASRITGRVTRCGLARRVRTTLHLGPCPCFGRRGRGILHA